MFATEPAVTVKRVMIVDDHPTVREGLGLRIESQSDLTVCGEASDVQEALSKIADCQPDVVIVDIALKSSNGLDLIKALQTRGIEVRVLVHSMYEEAVYAERCLRAGAMGYVNKEADSNEVIRAIHSILDDKVHVSADMACHLLGGRVLGGPLKVDPIDTLTDRQVEVFRLIGEGKKATQIAQRLHISVHTVETHRDNIKRKLGVESISELTRLAVLWESARQ